MAIALANLRDGEGLTAKASPEDVASIAHHKHQMFRHGYAGQTRRGCHVEAPVAPYELQGLQSGFAGLFDAYLPVNWRGLRSASFSRIPHRLGFLLPSRRPVRCPSRCIGHHLPGCAVLAAPGTFHSSRHRACKPFARNSLPRQQVQQAIADRRHLSVVLSKPSSSAGFKTSWKALTNDEILFDAGSTSHD